MEDLNKIYLKKEFTSLEDLDDTNTAFILLRDVKNYMIFKKIDTVTLDSEIVCLTKDEIKEKFYTAKEFIETSKFIGKSGYYKPMSELDKYTFESFIILYQNCNHMLIYDTILEQVFVTCSAYDDKDFIAFPGNSALDIKEPGFTKKRV